MALAIVITLVAAALAGVTFYYGGYYTSVEWIWLPFTLTFAYFWGLFLCLCLLMALYGFFIKKSKREEYPPTRWAMWFLGEVCYILFWFFRVRFHATGVGKLPSRKQACMIVSNHLSGFDHVGLISLCVKRKMVCVSKEENANVIAAGGMIRRAGYLTLKQGDILSGTKVIQKAGEYLKQGVSVCIAPEGTRNKTFPEPELLPFHPGSFQMAFDSHCPIVVFAIQNTNCVLKRFPWRFTDVYFDCVGLLTYEEYKDLTPAELAKKTQGMIARRFEQKRARFYHVKPKKEKKAE